MSETNSDVLEGFLCPMCMKDLKTQHQLVSHVEKIHPEDQDVLKSLKELVGKAKKKILNLEESDFDSFRSVLQPQTVRREYEKQDIGAFRSHIDYHKSLRSFKIEHFAAETNKLLIRLDKLINIVNNTDRRQHEQTIVQWLDGTTVNLCPSCTKSFNITRRQHHCRLCGSIMCNDCSLFLSLTKAKKMTGALVSQQSESNVSTSDNAIRVCEHCLKLLENRHALQERRLTQPPVCDLYQRLCNIMSKTEPSCTLYNKMCESLYAGESTYSLSDTQTIRAWLAKQAELIDLTSQRIANLQGTNKEMKLYQAVRRASTIYLKEKLLCLPQLPTQQALDALRKSPPKTLNQESTLAQNTVAIVSGWSPIIQPAAADLDETDPLIVQMDVIRGYIKEARKALRFEEVATLEANLRELQSEFFRKQQEHEENIEKNN